MRSGCRYIKNYAGLYTQDCMYLACGVTESMIRILTKMSSGNLRKYMWVWSLKDLQNPGT